MPKIQKVKSSTPETLQSTAINDSAPKKKARRGFAAISPERQREIASLGGKAAHAKGTAHQFSAEEARVAGRKGGQAAAAKKAAAAKAGTDAKG
jgi:general stress protein YciG